MTQRERSQRRIGRISSCTGSPKSHQECVPQDLAVMVFGWSRIGPLSLAPLGAPGCMAHTSLDTTLLLAGQNSQAVYELPIPNVLGLIGLHFYNQAIVFDASAGNPIGAVVSDAAKGVVGQW